jgi:hypothetical protein
VITSPVAKETKLNPTPIAGNSENETARIDQTELRVRGRALIVPSVQINGTTVITTGKWLKIASIRHEELLEGDSVADPELFVSQLKESGLRADLFTFGQRLPDKNPKHSYHIDWENAAAVSTTSFSEWWKERAEYSIRKAVNRSKKLGVSVRVAEFDDAFVAASVHIYNETPVRQGKAFWHYGKDFEALKQELATYLERSTFIGAYYDDVLIGFIKFTCVGTTATITQIISAKKHFDKRPNNALIAKAVEICELRGMSHLIYGSFVYYDADSSLTEFKRRNGFESVPLPRYFIPLTLKGKIALELGFHRELAEQIPRPVFKQLLRLRRIWYARKSKAVKENS